MILLLTPLILLNLFNCRSDNNYSAHELKPIFELNDSIIKYACKLEPKIINSNISEFCNKIIFSVDSDSQEFDSTSITKLLLYIDSILSKYSIKLNDYQTLNYLTNGDFFLYTTLFKTHYFHYSKKNGRLTKYSNSNILQNFIHLPSSATGSAAISFEKDKIIIPLLKSNFIESCLAFESLSSPHNHVILCIPQTKEEKEILENNRYLNSDLITVDYNPNNHEILFFQHPNKTFKIFMLSDNSLILKKEFRIPDYLKSKKLDLNIPGHKYIYQKTKEGGYLIRILLNKHFYYFVYKLNSKETFVVKFNRNLKKSEYFKINNCNSFGTFKDKHHLFITTKNYIYEI